MLVGHLGLGFIGKNIQPEISLGVWMLAVLLADMICFPLLILGVESFQIPGRISYSHSLLMESLWALLFAAGYLLLRRFPRGAWLLFAAVLSHWFLDFVSHPPDLQLAPGTQRLFGLGLWNSLPATLIVEGGLWLAAIVIYLRSSYKTKASFAVFWIGAGFLTLAWFGNVKQGMAPDPVRAGWNGLFFFSLIIAWAFALNRWVKPVPRAA